MTDTKTNYTLTDAELETVLDTVADKGEVAGIVALWELIHKDLPDGGVTWRIDPTAYAIPAAQWKVICQAMMDNPMHDGLAGGTMMNSGPSGWEDEPDRGQCDLVGCVIPTVSTEHCSLH